MDIRPFIQSYLNFHIGKYIFMILISISHIPNTGKVKYLAGYSIPTFKNPDKLLEKDKLVTKKSLPLPTVAGMN